MKSLFNIIFVLFITLCVGNVESYGNQLPPPHQRLSYSHFGTVVTIGNPEASGSLTIPSSSYSYSDMNVVNYLELGVDHGLTEYFGESFDIEVDVKVTPSLNGTPQASYIKTLQIEYHPFENGSYKDKEIHSFNGGDGFDFSIEDIRVTTDGVTTSEVNLPKNIYLDATINVDRRGDFTTMSNTPLSLNIKDLYDLDCDSQNDVLRISWNTEPTAIEYQLEWTFVNNYDGTSSGPGLYGTRDAWELIYDFRHNSTRITTGETFYDIPMVFESGYLLWRVRAVGVNLSNELIFGVWSEQNDQGIVAQDPNSAATANFMSSNPNGWMLNIDAHEVRKNWQLTTTFAEEGKKKEVISYYDGSLRNRQSVTVVNTDDNVIVGETIYDHQGRPALNVLPVPVVKPNCDPDGVEPAQASIKYYPKFNKYTGNLEYSRVYFDVDAAPCESGVSAMATSNGASQYYSDQNPNKQDQQAYVPDANGFPFTQVEYTPDNTGRIRKQSGVGPDFQLGSDHESKYYYGSPFQIKLDRLFASEVGYAAHYKKNLVVDPNGQVSVSYLDQEGRVVATALAGDSPDNLDKIPSLIDLETNGLPTLIVDVFEEDPDGTSTSNTLDVSGDAIVFRKEFLVSNAGEYHFEYDLESDVYKDGCTPDLCFNCVYDLKILLTNECSQTVLQNNANQDPILIEVNEGYFVPNANGGYSSIRTDCPANDVYVSPTYSFSADLEVGNYTLTKILTVNNDALLSSFEEYISEGEQLGCVQSFDEFLAEEMALIDTSGCNIDCDACVASLGTAEEYVSAGLGSISDYNLAVEACMAPCNTPSFCETVVEMMKADMSPGGQYGEYLVNGVNSASSFPLSVYNTSNVMPYNLATNNVYSANWRHPEVTLDGITYDYYLNDFGDSAKVYLTVVNNAGTITVSPDVMNPIIGAGGDVHFDPILNVYYAYPHRLASVYDFIDEFNQSWAQSLVIYHPEYCYYQTCLDYENEDADGNSSESFDKLMRSANSFAAAESKGLIELVGGNYQVANYLSGFVYDPFLSDPTFNPYRQDLIDAVASYKVINGVSYSMQEFSAIMTRAGNGMLSGSTSILSSYAGLFGDDNGTGSFTATNDDEWNTFKSLYLGKKRELQNDYEDAQALTSNCFNDCIGNDAFNPYTSGMWDPSTGFPYWTSSNPYYDSDNTCSYIRKILYLNKTKRFPDQDDLIGDADLNGLSNNAAYQSYLQTGQCPNALNLQNLLTEISDQGNLDLSHSLDNYVAYGLLYGSIFQYTNLPPLPSADWTIGQASGSYLEVKIQSADGTECPLYLTTISGTISWNLVTSFSGLTSTGIDGGLYSFTVIANLSDGTHVELKGKTCINLEDCEFAPVCEPNELALDVEEVMNLLAGENQLISSNYNFGAHSAYNSAASGHIQSLFGGSPSNTYKWTFTGTNNVASISDGLNELHLFFNSSDPSGFTGFSSIAYFDNVQSEHQHYFSIDAFDVFGNLLAHIEGEALYTTNAGADYEPVSFGECELPDPISCSQDEHQLREDLEDILSDVLVSENYNIYQSMQMTSLVESYLGGGIYSNETTNQITDQDGNIFDRLLITVNDDANDVCEIELLLNSSTNFTFSDIVSVDRLVAVGPMNGNSFTNFEMKVTFDNGSGPLTEKITGTSCLPLMNCDECEELIPNVDDDSVTVVEGKGELLRFILYNELVTAIYDLNIRLGYVPSDSDYVEAPSLKYVIRNNQFVVLEEYISFIENYDPSIDESAYLYDINKFYAEYGPHKNVYKEFERYENAVDDYNARATISGASQMVAMSDSDYVDNKIADYNTEYITYLKTEPATSGSADDPITFLTANGIVLATTNLSPCEILYNDYVTAHKYFFENANLSGDQLKICYEMHPLFSLEAINKLNLCCSVTGMNAFQDYIDSFYNLNKCPEKLPRLRDCTDPKVDFSEACYKAYELYKEEIKKYNYSPFAQAHQDVLIPLTAADFLAGEYCGCIENYLVYLENYVELPANSSDPLAQNVDEYGPCIIEVDDCASKYDDYVEVVASYNQYIKENGLNWPPIKSEIKLSQFIQEGLCYCTDAYVAYVNSLMDGHIDSGDFKEKLLYLEFHCEEAPCVPDNNVVLDTVSPFIIEFQDPCVEQALNTAALNAEINYNYYLNNLATTFISDMKNHCLGVDENMQMQFEDKEYHYTLYYYDQAGNLVKTVPPEGVEIVNTTMSSDMVSQAIIADRANKTQTVFTSHRLATKYKYNSLNQLTQQSLPDHDQMDVFDFTLADGLDQNLTITSVQFINETKGYLTGYTDYGNIERGILYSTNDGGQTWQKVENTLGSNLQAVQWIGTTGTAYAVGSEGILIYSQDGGYTWDMINTYTQNVTSQLNDLYIDEVSMVGLAVGNNSSIIEIDGTTITTISPVVSNAAYPLDNNDHITSITSYSGTYYITVDYTDVNSANYGMVYRSTDGITWEALPLAKVETLSHTQAIDAQNYIAVGNDGAFLKSMDGGDNWFRQYVDSKADFVDVYFSNLDEGIAIRENGLLYATYDGGLNWTLMDPNLSYNGLYAYTTEKVLAYGDNGEVGRVIMNSGTSFGIIEHNNPTSGNLIAGWAAEINGAPMIMVSDGSLNNIYYTLNASGPNPTWNSYGTTLGSIYEIEAAEFGGLVRGLLKTNFGMVYGFEADGTSFINSSSPVASSVTTLSKNPSSNEFILYESSNGELISVNGSTSIPGNGSGTTLTTLINPVTNSSYNVTDLSVDNSGHNHILVGNDGDIIRTENNNGNFVTTAQSNNVRPLVWSGSDIVGTSLAFVGENGSIGLLDLSTPSNDLVVLNSTEDVPNYNAVASKGSLAIVVGDEGASQKINSSGVTGFVTTGTTEDLLSVEMDPNSSNAYFGSASGQLLRATNYTTLNVILYPINSSSDEAINDIDINDNGVVSYVGNNSHIYQGGMSTAYQIKSIYLPVLNDVNFNNINNGYTVGDDYTVRYTPDAGETWKTILPDAGFTAGVPDVNTVFTLSNTLANVAGTDNYLARTNNSTATDLTLIPNVTSTFDWNDITYTDGNHGILVGGNATGQVWLTSDAGQNWNEVTSANMPAGTNGLNGVYGFERNNTFIAVGDNESMIYVQSLTDVDDVSDNVTSPSEDLHDVYFHDDVNGYAVGTNGTLLKSTNGALSTSGYITSLVWVDKDTDDEFSTQNKDIYTIDFATRYSGFLGGEYSNGSNNASDYARLLRDESEEFSTYFWYDKLGRIVVSQNSKQYNADDKRYSYTLYDELGRVVEAGEKVENDPTNMQHKEIFGTYVSGLYNPKVIDDAKLHSWINDPTGQRQEVTHSYYDREINSPEIGITAVAGFNQNIPNLRKRISAVTYEAVYDGANNTYNYGTFYDYDIHGNVQTLIQHNKDLAANPTTLPMQYKRVDYAYDLISGNVHEVAYQEGEADAWYHRYTYDGDNRISTVETSKDKVTWDQDAKYIYYDHGPLARVEIGENSVQGTDYVYTLQGWLKGVNSDLLNPNNDVGQDGDDIANNSNVNARFARDAMAFSLTYFGGDYSPIDYTNKWQNEEDRFISVLNPTGGSDAYNNRNDLYNGNIGAMVTTIIQPSVYITGGVVDYTILPQATAYQYDQLNRIKRAEAYQNVQNDNSQADYNVWDLDNNYQDEYLNTFTYDASGNIVHQDRYDHLGNHIEDLEYRYAEDNGKIVQNRLYSVTEFDTDFNGLYDDDIEDMNWQNTPVSNINDGTENYMYDQIGQLIQDKQEKIAKIYWRVDGKIFAIVRDPGSVKSNLVFDYDPMGNRIAKHEYSNDNFPDNGTSSPIYDPVNDRAGANWIKSTYYNRDAQGNVLCIYEYQVTDDGTTEFKQVERNIYGSSRLGMDKSNQEMIGATTPTDHYHTVGDKQYECSNHLGNVLTVISDRKFPVDETNDGTTDYYQPEILTTFDYSPFGVILKGRNFEKETCSDEEVEQETLLEENTFDNSDGGWQVSGGNASVSGGQLIISGSSSTNGNGNGNGGGNNGNGNGNGGN